MFANRSKLIFPTAVVEYHGLEPEGSEGTISEDEHKTSSVKTLGGSLLVEIKLVNRTPLFSALASGQVYTGTTLL